MTSPRPRRFPPARFNRFYLYLGSLWIAFILMLNTLPGSAFSKAQLYLLPETDKVAHFIVYAIMGALFWRATVPAPGESRRAPVRHPQLFAALIPAVVGLLDEINQHFVPGRSSDPADWITDATAGMAAAIFGAILYRSHASRRR